MMRKPPGMLKKTMADNNINWRTFAETGDSKPASQFTAVAQRWGVSMTPCYYLVDHHGVIRRKWMGHPGESVMDLAIKKLVEQADRQCD